MHSRSRMTNRASHPTRSGRSTPGDHRPFWQRAVVVDRGGERKGGEKQGGTHSMHSRCRRTNRASGPSRRRQVLTDQAQRAPSAKRREGWGASCLRWRACPLLQYCHHLTTTELYIYCTLLTSNFWTSRGHRCRPFSPPVLAFNFYRT